MSYKITKEYTKGNVTIRCNVDKAGFPLFRFRSLNDYTVSAFMKDELGCSLASTFNDPYDMYFFYDEKKIIEHLNKQYAEKPFINEITEIIVGHQVSFKEFLEIIMPYANMIFDIMKKSFGIACFSTDINSEIMWAHYTSNAKGFALEYNYNDLKELSDLYNAEIKSALTALSNESLHNENIVYDVPYLFPIHYINEKYNNTKIIIALIDFLCNEISQKLEKNERMNLSTEEAISRFFSTYGFDVNSINYSFYGIKNKCWQYEQEWRLIAQNLNYDIAHFTMGTIRPVAIYLGEYITDYNKQALINIAKEKQMNIFQMQTRNYSKGPALKAVRV